MSALRNFVFATVGPFVGMSVLLVGVAGGQKLTDFQGTGIGLAAEFTPVAIGLLLVGYLLRGQDKPWRGHVRGYLGLPFAFAGYAILSLFVAGVAASAIGLPL